jgi:hypothetical protein
VSVPSYGTIPSSTSPGPSKRSTERRSQSVPKTLMAHCLPLPIYHDATSS